MSSYDISELVYEVKTVLDRNRVSDGLVDAGDIETLTQNEIVQSKILDAARIIESKAPTDMLDGGTTITLAAATDSNTDSGDTDGNNTDDSGSADDNNTDSGGTDSSKIVVQWTKKGSRYVGVLSLPTDFLRLITIQMSDWERPARIISEDDAEYLLQSSRWSGVSGNPQKPVAAIVQGTSGTTLELYSCASKGATIKRGRYLKVPSISKGKIELCPLLKDAVVYMAGYLVCITLGDTQTASGLIQVAYELAHINMVRPTVQ